MGRCCGWLMAPALMALALTGCAGFDDYHYHDGWVMEGYPAAPQCGCATGPRSPAPHSSVPHSPPPPFSVGPTITPVSGSAMSPQTARFIPG